MKRASPSVVADASLSVPVTVKSRQYSRALSTMRTSGDASRALPLLRKAMDEGDYRAHYAVATWYLHGRQVERNVTKAVRLLKQAAGHDVPEAAFDLAICYEIGCGVPVDMDMAAAMYLRALRLGDRQAAHALERLFHHGIGVPKCRPLAAEFRRFAEGAPRGRSMSARKVAEVTALASAESSRDARGCRE